MGSCAARHVSHAPCGAAVKAPLLAHHALTTRRLAPHCSRHLPELVAVQRRPTATWGKVRGNHRDLAIRVNKHALSKLGFATRHPLYKESHPPKGDIEFFPFDQSHALSKELNGRGHDRWTNAEYIVPDHSEYSSRQWSSLEVFLWTCDDGLARCWLEGEIRGALFRLARILHVVLVRCLTEARAPQSREPISADFFVVPQVSLGPPSLRRKLLKATRYRYQA